MCNHAVWRDSTAHCLQKRCVSFLVSFLKDTNKQKCLFSQCRKVKDNASMNFDWFLKMVSFSAKVPPSVMV